MLTNEIDSLLARATALLSAKALHFSAAESCTGGLLLSTLTDVSGSSAYVLGGFVTYSNEAKVKFTGVQEATLVQHGAVSEACAREMAEGVRLRFGANIGMSITGIAGPGGGSPEKPVGLVYIGLSSQQELRVSRYVWSGDRIENKRASVAAALDMLVKSLESWPE